MFRKANVPFGLGSVGLPTAAQYAADIANRVCRWFFAKTATTDLTAYDSGKREPVEGWQKVNVTTVAGVATIAFPAAFHEECMSVVFSSNCSAHLKLEVITKADFSVASSVSESFTMCYMAKGV